MHATGANPRGSSTRDCGVVVITGGAGGVGMACARRLGTSGDPVILADLPGPKLANAVDMLSSEGLNVSGFGGDTAEPGFAQDLSSHASKTGPLSTLVCAAGISPSMSSGQRILEVNLLGTIRVAEEFLSLSRLGSVAVLISSIAGHRQGLASHDKELLDFDSPGFLARLNETARLESLPGVCYALSKRGLRIYVEKRATAWGARGGRIVSISPGLLGDTPMGRLEKSKGGAIMQEVSALRRLATADDIASAVEFMASRRASCITGVDLVVDGGAQAGIRWNESEEISLAWDGAVY